jgi:hypothetical protein
MTSGIAPVGQRTQTKQVNAVSQCQAAVVETNCMAKLDLINISSRFFSQGMHSLQSHLAPQVMFIRVGNLYLDEIPHV